MILFEDQIPHIVARMDDVKIYEDPQNAANNRVKPVKFQWGNSGDLEKFLEQTGESGAVPLIWSVPAEDTELPWGEWERTAELNFCAYEDRADLLNTQRLMQNYSFKQVLIPMWEDFQKKLKTSGNMRFVEGTIKRTLFPNFLVDDSREPATMWDVMKIRVKIQYSEPVAVGGCLK